MGKATVRPDGAGSIQPRGNRFRAQFAIKDEWVDGRRDRKFTSKTFDTEKAAEEWLRGQLTDRDRDQWVEPNKLTVAELLARWMTVKEPRLSPNTADEFWSIIRHQICRKDFGIGNVLAQKLTTDRIDTFYGKLRMPGGNLRNKIPTGLSETRIKRIHEVLTGCFGYAVARGIVVKNPCPSKDTPKPNDPNPQAWTAEELNAFLDQEDRICKVGPLWKFLADTGVRKSEALGLEWRSVDLAGCIVSINRRSFYRKSLKKMEEREGTKTKAGTRVIDLDPDLCHMLKEWKLAQGHGGQGLVFPFDSNAVDREYDRRVTTAGVPDYGIHHSFRDTWASLSLKAGVPLKVVSERLGHSDPAFTMRRYQKVLPGMGKDATATFSALLAAARAASQ